MAGNIKLYKAGNYIIVEHADNQLTLGTADSDIDVVIDRDVRQYNLTTQHLTARAATDSDELEVVTASGEFVLGAINHARVRDNSGSTFGGNRDAVVTAMNGSTLFGATTLESRVSANTTGRTTNATNIGTLQTDVSDAETDIVNLKKALKFNTNDRGVFLNDNKAATASLLHLQQQEVKLQVGTTGRTNITSTESSPGIHDFNVQAGASGSEATVRALRIAGSSTNNSKASIETSTGTSFVANSAVQLNGNTTMKALSFASSGSPHLVSFSNATVSGLAASAIGSGTFSTARIPGLGSSKITSGTLADARISSSSVTQHAGDIDLADLGDVNDTAPTDGQVLTWDNTNSYWKPATVSGGGSGISELSDDTSPQLGGHLDVDGSEIRNAQTNGNILLRPDGTGTVVTTAELTLDYTNPQIKFKGDDNIHYRISVDEANNEVVIGHTTYEGIRMDSYGALTFPNIDGSPSGGTTAGYLKVDSSGNVSTDTPTDTNTNIGNTDFTLSAARKLMVGGYDFSINDTTNSPLFLWDDSADIFEFRKPVLFTNNAGYTTGEVRLMEAPAASGAEYVGFKAPGNIAANCLWTLPASDGTNGQVLTTNGSKTLSWTTASGGGSSTLTQVFTQSFLDDISTTTHYLPWKDINEQTTVYQEEAAFVMPYDGKIKQVTIRVATQVDNAGNFTVGVYTCPIGSSIFSQGNWTLEESEVLAFNGGSQADDHHAFHFVFDDAKHFDAGDAVSIGLRASVDPGTNSYWYVTTVVEWDTTNGLGSSSTELTTNP